MPPLSHWCSILWVDGGARHYSEWLTGWRMTLKQNRPSNALCCYCVHRLLRHHIIKFRSRFARPALVATQLRVRHQAPSFQFAAAASAVVSFTSVGHQPFLGASTFYPLNRLLSQAEWTEWGVQIESPRLHVSGNYLLQILSFAIDWEPTGDNGTELFLVRTLTHRRGTAEIPCERMWKAKTRGRRIFCWWIMWAKCRYSKNSRDSLQGLVRRGFQSGLFRTDGYSFSRSSHSIIRSVRPWEIHTNDRPKKVIQSQRVVLIVERRGQWLRNVVATTTFLFLWLFYVS